MPSVQLVCHQIPHARPVASTDVGWSPSTSQPRPRRLKMVNWLKGSAAADATTNAEQSTEVHMYEASHNPRAFSSSSSSSSSSSRQSQSTRHQINRRCPGGQNLDTSKTTRKRHAALDAPLEGLDLNHGGSKGLSPAAGVESSACHVVTCDRQRRGPVEPVPMTLHLDETVDFLFVAWPVQVPSRFTGRTRTYRLRCGVSASSCDLSSWCNDPRQEAKMAKRR